MLTFSPDELVEITGGLRQPAAQLRELHRQGFHRARRGSVGQVILERAHYEAVCSGRLAANDPGRPRPRVRRPSSAAA
jgi:hypothetical protein